MPTVPKSDLLQGTLDLLILKILTFGPNHGWGIANRIVVASWLPAWRASRRDPNVVLRED